MREETEDVTVESWWDRRAELAVALLLAALTVLLAWSGFQASKWSGVQAINFSDAGRVRVDSNAALSIGTTEVSSDTGIFVSWLEAAQPAFEAGNAPDGVTTGDGWRRSSTTTSPTAFASPLMTGLHRAAPPTGFLKSWTAM